MPSLTMLPAKPGTCPLCAVDHKPDEPHNAQSLFYQMRFNIVHGRSATWADAISHCSDRVKQLWTDNLKNLDAWSEPDGEPIAEREEPKNVMNGIDSSDRRPIFEVGMQFFFVHNERRHTKDRIVTITKIGRKWATLSDGNRFDYTAKDWRLVDGGRYSSPGRLWDSEQQYRDNKQTQEILHMIMDRYCYGRNSESVSLSAAKQVASLLGIKVE